MPDDSMLDDRTSGMVIAVGVVRSQRKPTLLIHGRGFVSEQKQCTLAPTGSDPFTPPRQMTSELDRAFENWPSLRWPSFNVFEALSGGRERESKKKGNFYRNVGGVR